MKFTPRLGFALGFSVCAALLGFAYYLQYVDGQEPCPLCMVQRLAFFAVGAVFLMGLLHGPGRMGAMIYGGAALVFAALGVAVAARHVWLQSLPKHLVPECGPGLDYMLKKFPLADVLSKVLKGSGECAEAGWKFLGVTIAGWSLAWFIALGILAMVIVFRARAARHVRTAL
jgi:disulfide bond formation protein DsbB